MYLFSHSHFVTESQENFLELHLPEEHHTTLAESKKKDVSLVLYTGHPLLDGVRPTVPNFQYVSFMHCRPSKPLPQEFQAFMDKSLDNGVILVSFGTLEKGQGMPGSVQAMMLEVFSRLEQNVIWKWEGNFAEGVPANVMISKWVPQQDILAHPATKLFVSHVGQSSVQEAVYHEKPVVN